jgi:hypothetical protein
LKPADAGSSRRRPISVVAVEHPRSYTTITPLARAGAEVGGSSQ